VVHGILAPEPPQPGADEIKTRWSDEADSPVPSGLLAGVEAGQFDAGIFYKHEVVAHKLPFITFPPEINLGDPQFSSFYAQASYQPPSGDRVSGAPILFTITVPKTVKNQEGAEAFVRFLLSSPDLLKGFGFGIVEHRVGGSREQIPADLRGLTSGTYTP
jgi:molybdate/tungstate transport system substrate-binding protein